MPQFEANKFSALPLSCNKVLYCCVLQMKIQDWILYITLHFIQHQTLSIPSGGWFLGSNMNLTLSCAMFELLFLLGCWMFIYLSDTVFSPCVPSYVLMWGTDLHLVARRLSVRPTCQCIWLLWYHTECKVYSGMIWGETHTPYSIKL